MSNNIQEGAVWIENRLSFIVRRLFYIPGGIERVLTAKANYLADVAGYTVYIILTDGQDKSPYYPLSSQIRLIQLGIEFEELWDLPLYKK